MKIEIFSEDIRKCPHFCILVLHSYNQCRNDSFESGWKTKLKGAHWPLYRAHKPTLGKKPWEM